MRPVGTQVLGGGGRHAATHVEDAAASSPGCHQLAGRGTIDDHDDLAWWRHLVEQTVQAFIGEADVATDVHDDADHASRHDC